jgi:hypothetical protein
MPWIRVKLSCAIGNSLYPHPQWPRLANLWEAYYPVTGLEVKRRQLLRSLETSMPTFVRMLITHRPETLHGRSLLEAMAT